MSTLTGYMHEWYKSTGIDPLPLRVTELTPPHLHKHTHQVLFWNIEKDWGRSGGGNPRTEGEERDSKRYDICNKNCNCPGSRRFYFESARKIPWEPEDFFSRATGCFSVALWPIDRIFGRRPIDRNQKPRMKSLWHPGYKKHNVRWQVRL